VKKIADRKFLSLFDDKAASAISDLRFERCVFTNCVLADTKDPSKRSHVRNVQLADCSEVGCSVGPAILEDVLIDGLKTSDLFIIWGALFRHVILRGRVGSIKINALPDIDESKPDLVAPFQRARDEFYKKTDWAIDISDAVVSSFDATGIPARLFRRDPLSQAVVRRRNVEGAAWRKRVARGNPWMDTIDVVFEDDPPEDTVLVAPKAARKAKFQAMV
jgi:hypothetical protein